MKNLVGYTALQNPDWITLRFEDGTESTPVHDPAGEYRAEADQIAKKIAGVPPDPMANATASVGGELVGAPGAAVSKADAVAPTPGLGDFRIIDTPAGGKPPEQGGDAAAIRGALKTAMRVEGPAGMPAGEPAAAPAEPIQQQPPQQLPGAGMGPLVTTGSSSSWQKTDNKQRSSTGISEADRPKVEQTQEAAIQSAEQANEADFAARANQVWSEWGRLTEKAKQQVAERSVLQEQERQFSQKLESAYKKYDEDAKRPIDPAQAFAGEKKWYAFMAGFGDVLRNVGAALAGKGPVVDPGKVLDDLVERSVQLQMAQKEQDLKAGRISIDRFNADRETIRHKLGVVVSQLAQTELDKAQNEQAYKALGAVKAKGDAIIADARAKGAQALARQETIAESQSRTSGGSTERGRLPAAGGIDQLNKLAEYEKRQLELKNAYRAQATADQASKDTGHDITPERLKEIRDKSATIDPQMAKLDQLKAAVDGKAKINGATINWETGEIQWPKDLGGVSAVKARDVISPLGGALRAVGVNTELGEDVEREVFNTSASQLDSADKFVKELITTDTTGAVSSLQQDPVFMELAGGAKRNESVYKQNVQRLVDHISSKRQSYLSGLGEDGAAWYRHTENRVKNAGKTPSIRQVGQLPEGRR